MDPENLASLDSEAIWSGSTLFSKDKYRICFKVSTIIMLNTVYNKTIKAQDKH